MPPPRFYPLAARTRRAGLPRRRGERPRHRQELPLLHEMLAIQHDLAAAGSDSTTIGSVIARHARILTRADGAAVEWRQGDELVELGAAGQLLTGGTDEPHRMHSLSGLALRTRTPQRSDDTQTDPRVNQDRARKLGVRSILVTPLCLPDGTEAVLLVTARVPRAFGTHDELALQVLRGMLEPALQMADAAAARAVARRDALYEALARHAWDLVSITDQDGMISYASPSHRQVLGWEPEALVGTPGRDLLHPDDREQTLEQFARFRDGPEKALRFETRMRHADGTWRHLEIIAIDHREDPEISGVIFNAHDITERAAVEAALRAREQQLSTLIADLPVILFAMDSNGVYTLSEGKGLEAVGRGPGAIVGHSVTEVWAHSCEAVDSVRRALAGESTTEKLMSGNVVLESRLTPVRDAAGKVTGLIGVAIDITDQVRANQSLLASEQRFRTLVEHAPIGICILGAERIIEAVNPALCALFGIAEKNLLGQPVERILPGVQAAIIGEAGSEGEEVELQATCGRPLTCLISTTAIGDSGGEEKQAVFLIDVTEQAGAHRQSEQARMAAEQLAALRNDFVAAVSHELRTPLTAIVGFAELLQAHWAVLDDGRRQEQINRIVASANRQQQLIQDLLLLSREEADQPMQRARPEFLAELVERAAAEVRGAYRGQQVIIEGPCATRVLVRHGQVLRILVNLLDNAAKYSNEGSPIAVQWQTSDGLARLVVRDQGPGIPERGRSHLFTRFGRIPGSRMRAGRVGTGLGLYLARRLAEAMGGSLDLEETSPQGSAFRLCLPLAEEDQ